MPHLTPGQLRFFEENGYLIIDDVLSEADLAAIRAEYNAILDREVPRLIAEGKVVDDLPGATFEARYAHVLPQLSKMYDLYQHLDISLPLLHRMEPDATLNAGPAVFNNVLRNSDLLDIAESILGPEIDCNPVQHTRIKPPRSRLSNNELDSNVARTMLHQDEGVLNTDIDDDMHMLTVWVAMTDATPENGCMMAYPGSHRGGITMHCPGDSFSSAEFFIPDELAKGDWVPMPVKAGGVALLHQKTIHGSLENRTSSIRWSFDLRYNARGQRSGRQVFPSFLARSRSEPEAELTDASEYERRWFSARDDLAAKGDLAFNERWKPFSAHPLCA